MRKPQPKGTYKAEYDDLMDGRVHLIECASDRAAVRKAAALRTAARTRHMDPVARCVGTTVAFMARERSSES